MLMRTEKKGEINLEGPLGWWKLQLHNLASEQGMIKSIVQLKSTVEEYSWRVQLLLGSVNFL